MTSIKEKSGWTTGKLIVGILSILFFFILGFQSFVVVIDNALSPNKDVSGMLGMVVALLLLVSGIIGIMARNSKSRNGTIACIILYGLSTVLSFCGTDTFSTLKIWGMIPLIFGVILVFSFKDGALQNKV